MKLLRDLLRVELGCHAYPLTFLLFSLLRAVPEALVPKYPVGYDTVVYYAPEILHLHAVEPLELLSKAPLFYLLMWAVRQAINVDVYLLLKFVGPTLYGMMAASFLLFLRRGLGWGEKRGLLATFLCFTQPVTLRISWDLFRNELGMFFFFALLAVVLSKSEHKTALAGLLAALTVLTHEFASILVFIAVPWIALRMGGEDGRRMLLALAPASILFLYQVVPLITASTFTHPPENPRVIRMVEEPLLTNYLSSPMFSGVYLRLVEAVAKLTAYCYLPLLPLAAIGFQRHPSVDPMTGWLCFASYAVLLLPTAYPFYTYYRWLILLTFPISIYAANGLSKMVKRWRLRGAALAAVILLLSLLSGLGYASGMGTYMRDPVVNSYLPPHLATSSMDPSQIDDCIECLRWLNSHAGENSVLLVEERFRGWALVYLSEEIFIAWYPAHHSVENTPINSLSENFSHVYLMWYSVGGPADFRLMYMSGDIAVYQYLGSGGGAGS